MAQLYPAAAAEPQPAVVAQPIQPEASTAAVAVGDSNGVETQLQALQGGLGAVMQTVSTLNAEASAAMRSELGVKAHKEAEDTSAVESLERRVEGLEHAQTPASRGDPSKLLLNRIEVLEKAQKDTAQKRSESQQIIAKRLAALEEKNKNATTDSTSTEQIAIIKRVEALESQEKTEVETVGAELVKTKDDLQDMQQKFNESHQETAKLEAEVQKLQAEDDQDDQDAKGEPDSEIQLSARNHPSLRVAKTVFHAKTRGGL